MSKPIRIVTVDDHLLIREGLAALLSSQTDIELVGEACNGQEAVEIYEKLKPDVMLMDLQMPLLGGIEAITAIRARHPFARIIVLTTYDTEQLATKAMASGAQAYLLKSNVRRELADTIRDVARGKFRLDKEIIEALTSRADEDELSLREREVLQLISEGNTNRQVGFCLSISEDTVKGHVKSILAKLSARDRAHAVALAMRKGILTL